MTKNPAAPAILTISLPAVRENYRILKSITKASIAGVVKADSYGIGAIEVFKTLTAEGCTEFFVATPDEAIELRTLDQKASIMVLGGIYEGTEDLYASNNITPVLNSPEQITRWQKQAAKSGQKVPAVLHFDTGMNRLGIRNEDIETLNLNGLDVEIVMSHFACSDEKDHPMSETQAKRFAMIAERFPKARKSLCNSSGIFRNKDWHYDLLRPGFALYGGNPTPETKNPMKSVVTLEARVLQIHAAKKGETAGYNATHTFENDTQCAVLALGYADGIFRSASNKAKLYWNGVACPIVGRVSMDLIIVDIGHLQNPPAVNNMMEVLGPHQGIDDLASDSRTIGYEILTSLGKRYHRIYES